MRWAFIFFTIFLLSANLTFAAASAPVFISQVQISAGVGKTDDDFIELFNPNTLPVNLKGFRLVKRTSTSSSDTLIKSWTKDAIVPVKSFYLWANSGYGNITAKPDVTTSATISNDSGVALRFGANDTGTIISSIAWGKSNNGFTNVSAINPGANQSVNRKDLYDSSSSYTLAASNPRNSSVNDLAAAFAQSQITPKSQSTVADKLSNQTPVDMAATDTVISFGQVEGESTVNTSSATNEEQSPAYVYGQNQPAAAKTRGIKYLILSIAALLTLIFVAWKFIKIKKAIK